MKKYNQKYGYLVSNKLTDNDLMPFGPHKGLRMIDVPDEHLFWLSQNQWLKDPVKSYVEDNLDAIISNLKDSRKL